MHDNRLLVEARIQRFMTERLAAQLYRETVPLRVEAWACPDEPVPCSEAMLQQFEPFDVGGAWGLPWGTTWFRFSAQVPADWAGKYDGGARLGREGSVGLPAGEVDGAARLEAVIDLGCTSLLPGFQAEGMAYRPDGSIIKGVEPLNMHVPLDPGPDGRIEFYVEAASNPNVADGFLFAPTPLGDKATAGSEPQNVLARADLALLDVQVWELMQDFRTLDGLMRELPGDLPRRHEILRALERALNAADPQDLASTASAVRACLAEVLSAPAYASAHRIYAVGHAHIDSAWLWPVRETVRKVARTFSNVLDLIEEHPDFVFTASSAQQYAWLKEHYPELFERVAVAVRGGRFVPAGGMWVEPDTNMAGGEALARQFVAGKRFFLENFGVEPLEVWLPDSFGYSGALPQIVKAAGSRWFLTQKISWNDTNRFPHHTFQWEGIDGSRIFTHFPPADTYSSDISAAQLAHAQRNYREKGPANTSLLPFGWGDGGGGPTREMLAAAFRTADLEGSPRVQLSCPETFFRTAEAEYPEPPVFSGELYLEFHRGTYTSQARTKRGNRRSEHLLREAELWATTAAIRKGAPYPYDELERAWQTVLLQQFHDILPGSSIAWVHQEAERNYAWVTETLEGLIADALAAIVNPDSGRLSVNAGPYPIAGVPGLGGGTPAGAVPVRLEHGEGGWTLRSEALELTIDDAGLLTSLLDRGAGRELVPAGLAGNLFQVFRDMPNQWDAWDLDEHYKSTVAELRKADFVEPLETNEVPGLRIRHSFGDSLLTEQIRLSQDGTAVELEIEVDWHEQQKLLKLMFPLDVHADRAASEIQFGHIYRPTHSNTSWDASRFETVAHRWTHVAEPGYGVALANDATYGYDIGRAALADGAGTYTSVRASLLRAPLFPDPGADQGRHPFRFSLRPNAGIPEAVAEGYRLNLPLRIVNGSARGTGAGAEANDASVGLKPLFAVDNPAVVIEAVKLAEDRSGDVVIRLYEAHGARAEAVLQPDFDYDGVAATDLLEREIPAGWLQDVGSEARLRLRPFQLATLRFRR